MIEFEEHSRSLIFSKNNKNNLIFKRKLVRNSFYQSSLISMRLGNSETLVVQVETNNIFICKNDNKGINFEEMFESNGLETSQCDKNLWKSTLWQSISAPPSPTSMPLQSTHILQDMQKNIPLIRCLKPQSRKFHHPPLEPLEWKTLKNEENNERNQLLSNSFSSKRGLIGANMKLDLNIIQQEKDSCQRTELQQKRDKFAYFDKECSQVLKHVYLGSEAVARNRKTLLENGITHVLNCVGFVCSEYFPEDLSYKTLWLQDSPNEDITSILYDVFDYFEEVRENGGRVFVHCCQGVSRSTSLVIAYLMWVGKHTFEDAFQHVKAARGITNPNMGFACQLLQCQKRMHAIPISPKSTFRMYRMAPHSPYDPMHLIPKKVNNPHFAALDSRGAFVILTPNTLFIWQGSKCDDYMIASAHHFISQVVQYEKAKGQTIHILEGEESEDFWNTFKNRDSHINTFVSLKSEANEKTLSTFGKKSLITRTNLSLKKISLYDKDFETYIKAKDEKYLSKDIDKELNFIAEESQDSCWMSHVQKTSYDQSEKSPCETCKLSVKNVDEKTILLEKDEFKNCEEIGTTSRSLSSSNASQCSSTSSLSFHSLLSNSSQSPPTIASPCVSPPASQNPIVSNMLSLESSSMLPSINFHIENLSPHSSISISSPSNDNQSKGSFLNGSFSLSSPKMLENNSLINESNISTFIDGNTLFPKTNLQKSTISNENAMECDLMELQTNNTRYKKDGSTKTLVQTLNVFNKKDRFNSSSEARCNSQKEEQGESSSSRCKEKEEIIELRPILFEWPQMEKIDMFDADDLDSNGAFVLIVSDDFNRSKGRMYLWVGSFLQTQNDQDSTTFNSDEEEQIRRHWQQIGKDLICRFHLQDNTHIEIVFDGKEPNEFWDYFING